MSNKAILIQDDGTEKLIFGKDYSPEDLKGKTLLCAGKIHGKCCRAEVEAVHLPGGQADSYFRIKDVAGNRHIRFCPNDEMGSYKIIKNVDEYAAKTSLEKLYLKLSKATSTQGKETAEKETSSDKKKDALVCQETDDDKVLIQEKRPPKNLKELYVSLSSLSLRDQFGEDGTVVGDHIIDKRNVVKFSKNGIPSDTIMLVAGKRTAKKNYEGISKEYVVLANYFMFSNNLSPIFYVLRFRNDGDAQKIKSLIFEDKDQSGFLILSKWTPFEVDKRANYYISDPLTTKQVEKMPKNLL